jgi:hypothetical protein
LLSFGRKEVAQHLCVQPLEVHLDWQVEQVLSSLCNFELSITQQLEVALFKDLEKPGATSEMMQKVTLGKTIHKS